VLLVHLSDLHHDPTKEKDERIVRDALFADVERMRCTVGVPDLVLFSGDLVQSGDDGSGFSGVRTVFLEPLAAAAGCREHRLLIAPGNHDIQRSLIDAITESGLSHELQDAERLNHFIDNITSYPAATARLRAFNEFRAGLSKEYLVSQTELWSTYRVPCAIGSIGVACLNTAWRATGRSGDFDRERLLLSERQVDEARRTIVDTQLQVAVFHHPLEWLMPFDRKVSGRRILAEFNVVLTGHNHQADAQAVSTLSGNALLNQAGCLYSSRDYFNGYSWISYDTRTETARVMLREYSDHRRAFDKATRLAADGVIAFRLAAPMHTAAVTTRVADRIYEAYGEQFNRHLLSANVSTRAPKELKGIFVHPSLSTVPEPTRVVGISHDQKIAARTRLSVEEIIAAPESFVIVGKAQYGRTTLLHWITQALTDSLDPRRLRIPLFFPFSEIPKSYKVLLRRLKAKAVELIPDEQVALDRFLQGGECVILIDDVDHADTDRLAVIRELLSAYPKNRVIASVEETLWAAINLEVQLDLGAPYRTAYLLPLGRRQTKELVRKWLQNSRPDLDDVVEEVLQALHRVSVPVTPFLVSTVLSILESGRQLSLVNYAALLESLLEDFLQKAESSSGDRGLLDYRNRGKRTTNPVSGSGPSR
jgi:hypothetical protein